MNACKRCTKSSQRALGLKSIPAPLFPDFFWICGAALWRGRCCHAVTCRGVPSSCNRTCVALASTCALLVALLVCGCGSSGATDPTVASVRPAPGRPNIVFVLTDDLSWNLVRYMPQVLAMQRHGVTLRQLLRHRLAVLPLALVDLHRRASRTTRASSPTARPTAASRASTPTARSSTTFAIALQRAGYQTAMMGKYLNGYQPDAEGRDRPYVPPGWTEWDVAGNGYPEFNYTLNENGHRRPLRRTARRLPHRRAARKGVDFIDAAAEASEPFCSRSPRSRRTPRTTPAPRDANDFPGLRPRAPRLRRASTNAPAWLATPAADRGSRSPRSTSSSASARSRCRPSTT